MVRLVLSLTSFDQNSLGFGDGDELFRRRSGCEGQKGAVDMRVRFQLFHCFFFEVFDDLVFVLDEEALHDHETTGEVD